MPRLAITVAVAVCLVLPATAQATLVYQRSTNDRLIAARDDGTHARVIARLNEPVAYVGVSPNGRWAAFLTTGSPISDQNAGNICVIDLRGGRPRQLLKRDVSLSPIAWSPDSRHLVVGDVNASKAIVVDAATGAHFALHLDDGFFFAGASFSPRGVRVAVGAVPVSPTAEGDLDIFNAGSGEEVDVAGEGQTPAWGRRGFAYRDLDGLEFTSQVDGSARTLLPAADEPVPVGWSANGRRLLAVVGEGEAHLLTPSENADRALPQAFAEVDALSRDGAHVLGVAGHDVVSVSAAGNVRILARHARSASWNR